MPKLPEEDQIRWVQDTIVGNIAQIVLRGDRVEEIVVLADMYDVVSAGIAEAKLPSSFPEQPNTPREILENWFHEQCLNITLRSASIDQLAVENATNVPAETIFIRFITTQMKQEAFLASWDRQIGFTESLLRMNSPIMPTTQDRKLIFLLHTMLDCLGRQAEKIELAKAPPNFR